MSIDLNNKGFIYWAEGGTMPALGMDSDRLSDCITETKRRKLEGVFGTVPYFRESNLDFLFQLPFLKEVQFWDVTLKDISGLYNLNQLTYLRISGKRPPLDFERLRGLRCLILEHHKKDTVLDCLESLERLYLWHYRAPDKSVFGLELPRSLKQLHIFWTNFETLDGLEPLPNLTLLELERCRNLKSLGRLVETCPKLERLVIGASGRLTADEAKRATLGHPKLHFLFAANKRLLDKRSD